MSSLCYSTYLANIKISYVHNPRSFWQYIKKTKNNNDLLNNMLYEYSGISFEEPLSISNLFFNYFAFVYVKPILPSQSLFRYVKDLLSCSSFVITVEEVFGALSYLDFDTVQVLICCLLF